MAKQLESFSFKTQTSMGSGQKWDWAQYLNGKIWQLDKEDLGETSVKTMNTMVRSAAKRRKMKVSVNMSIKTNTITFQARPMTPEELAALEAEGTETTETTETQEQPTQEPKQEEPVTTPAPKPLTDDEAYIDYVKGQEEAGKKPKSRKNWDKARTDGQA